MLFEFKKIKIFYNYKFRKSEVTNIFLHGWGCDHKSFLFCEEYLKKDNMLFVDFPPFGKSGAPVDWTIFTYANMVISLCDNLGIKKFNLIGHSFGGRVAILVSVLCKGQVPNLVLVDSAGLKPRRSLGYWLRVLRYKIRKRLGWDVSNFGSCDYLALDCHMRKVFNNIVTMHLDEFLPYIKARTLIVFGKDDRVTPVYMAKKLRRKIKNSNLLLLDNAGHFSFVDKRVEFITSLKSFLEEKN